MNGEVIWRCSRANKGISTDTENVAALKQAETLHFTAKVRSSFVLFEGNINADLMKNFAEATVV